MFTLRFAGRYYQPSNFVVSHLGRLRLLFMGWDFATHAYASFFLSYCVVRPQHTCTSPLLKLVYETDLPSIARLGVPN